MRVVMALWVATGLIFATLAADPAAAGIVTAARADFGLMPDGSRVEIITLENHQGVRVSLMSLGASVQSILLPDRHGRLADVVLGYPSLAGYLAQPNYFGATVGRFANRIAKGRFTLDGQVYSVPVNDGPNSLHGGTKGFDKVNWTVMSISSGPKASVEFGYVSPNGDQGYPGTLKVTATYALNDQNELTVDYRATTDKPTIVNLSNHTYWNLAGDGSSDGVMGQLMTIKADAFTPVDATFIPIGEIRSVAGTAFDFRTPKPIGLNIRDGNEQQLLLAKGYDHNWVISRSAASEPRLVARVEDPQSGRVLELLSAQPGLQFYSGNFLDGTIVGRAGRIYRQGDAFVLEPQIFPNTPNEPTFGSARLDPGQAYHNLIVFRFSIAKAEPQ
jgi:aldose 1-epimerase